MHFHLHRQALAPLLHTLFHTKEPSAKGSQFANLRLSVSPLLLAAAAYPLCWLVIVARRMRASQQLSLRAASRAALGATKETDSRLVVACSPAAKSSKLIDQSGRTNDKKKKKKQNPLPLFTRTLSRHETGESCKLHELLSAQTLELAWAQFRWAHLSLQLCLLAESDHFGATPLGLAPVCLRV